MSVSMKRAIVNRHNNGAKRSRISVKREPEVDVSLPPAEFFDDRGNLAEVPEITNGEKLILNEELKNDVIEISDGEELYAAFPMTSSPNDSNRAEKHAANKRARKKSTAAIPKKQRQPSSPESKIDNDDDNDITVLFESKTESVHRKTAPTIQENKVSELIEVATSSKSIALKSRPSPVSSEDRYGVVPCVDKKTLERVIKNREKYPKEFKSFDKHIWNHLTDNLQNDHTYAWKMRVRKRLQETIEQLYPDQDCALIAVGSTVNGCGSFNSDMDLCLCLPCPDFGYGTDRGSAIKHLKKIRKLLLREREFVRHLFYIPAKVPILKINFHSPYDTLEVDMNVNNVPGIYNSYLLHYYSRIDDRFPALSLIVKNWAKRQGIGDASAGFFNSYSLILMVLHFLQCAVEPPVLPNLQMLYPEYFEFHKSLDKMPLFQGLPEPLPETPQNRQSVGELLVLFFLYYKNFDFEKKFISIQNGSIMSRSELPQNTRRFKIFIEEPFDQQNTARCVTHDDHWNLILDAFERAASSLTSGPPDLRNILV